MIGVSFGVNIHTSYPFLNKTSGIVNGGFFFVKGFLLRADSELTIVYNAFWHLNS